LLLLKYLGYCIRSILDVRVFWLVELRWKVRMQKRLNCALDLPKPLRLDSSHCTQKAAEVIVIQNRSLAVERRHSVTVDDQLKFAKCFGEMFEKKIPGTRKTISIAPQSAWERREAG